MAEGFELYHVPQQSRRDKLRVNTSSTSSHLPLNNSNNSSFQFQPTTILTSNHQQQQQQAGGLVVPFYDPSLHLDLLTCAGGHGLIHPQSSHLLGGSSQTNNRSENPSVVIKGEGTSFMGFLGNPPNQANNSSSSSPSLIDPNNSQVFYAAQSREFGHSQGLSLSLSSHNNNNNNNNSNNNTHLPMELNFQYSAPPGPFTGYTSVLKGSVFLRPAQQLLQEICDVGGFCSGEKSDADLSLFDPSSLDIHPGLDDSSGLSDGDGVGAQAKSRLISMLDEVYRKYKQCYQQVQAVVASFESIPGLNNAAPFANFALKALSKHFKCLKSAISDQLRFISKTPGTLAGRKHGHEESSENDKFALYSQRPVHSGARIMDNQPVWRPQRGLPERAVSVLRSWLFEHFLHPYPTDTDKMMLAKQTGLSRSQVSNWFINARVRIWKPMVEEIHALETNQQAQQQAASTSSQAEPFQPGQTNSNKDHTRMSQASCSSHDVPPEKRVRNELVDLPLTVHHHENPQLNMDYAQFGVSNGVSLTLALHQHNHGINGLLDPFRYGLPTDGNGCVVGPGFEAQTRHFSTRDVMGGQLLHDFVG